MHTFIFGFLVLITSLAPLKAETLIIATGEYPPWTSEKLEHGGVLNHAVQVALDRAGYSVKFEYMPWKRALEITRLGRAHATSFWSKNEDREKDFIHSYPIDNTGFVLFHRKDTPVPDWENLIDLSDLRFGATRGYTYSKEFWQLQEEGKIRVAIRDDDISNLEKLMEKEIDLFPLQKFTGQYLARQQFGEIGSGIIVYHSKALVEQTDHVLFSRAFPNAEILVGAFNKQIKQVIAEGKIEQFKIELLK